MRQSWPLRSTLPLSSPGRYCSGEDVSDGEVKYYAVYWYKYICMRVIHDFLSAMSSAIISYSDVLDKHRIYPSIFEARLTGDFKSTPDFSNLSCVRFAASLNSGSATNLSICIVPNVLPDVGSIPMRRAIKESRYVHTGDYIPFD